MHALIKLQLFYIGSIAHSCRGQLHCSRRLLACMEDLENPFGADNPRWLALQSMAEVYNRSRGQFIYVMAWNDDSEPWEWLPGGTVRVPMWEFVTMARRQNGEWVSWDWYILSIKHRGD
jgi:hypothetical protein